MHPFTTPWKDQKTVSANVIIECPQMKFQTVILGRFWDSIYVDFKFKICKSNLNIPIPRSLTPSRASYEIIFSFIYFCYFGATRKLIRYRILLSLRFLYLESYFLVNFDFNLVPKKLHVREMGKVIAEFCMFRLHKIY